LGESARTQVGREPVSLPQSLVPNILAAQQGTGRLFRMPRLPAALEEHFRAPRHARALGAAARRGVGENAACGDALVLELEFTGDRIANAAFRARGCSAVIALADLVCERVRGLTLAEASAFDVARAVEGLGGLPPARRHAVEVCRRALAQACA
jgi:nitrogen fixation NifU-like protein